MEKNELFSLVAARFSAAMPAPASELDFRSAYELLVAVVLSAQCTDKRVNMVTPAVFAAYPSVDALAGASVDELYHLVRSISYPRAKATHLVAAARMVVERHGSTIPSTRAELEALPGVGRKTAAVVLSVAFGQNHMAVDTHVFRVARRLGLAPVEAKTPLAVEQALVEGFPPHLLGTAHHWLILHGRYVCTAKKPRCADCLLNDLCAMQLNAQRLELGL